MGKAIDKGKWIKQMIFSELFKIDRDDSDDWFDTVLTIDTKLFLDPFLIYADERDFFEGSHDEIIAFFEQVFRLVATSQGDSTTRSYGKALVALVFPEVKELCLGYTGEGTDGLGSGQEIARLIAGGLLEAINAGLEEITHFEEVGIIRENIGADRISDITAGLLRWRLAAYTLAVCEKHKVPTVEKHYLKGKYDFEQKRWVPLTVRLPHNPHNGKGILLAPRRYLRDLPTINADSFWEYCCSNENATLRAEFGDDISSRMLKQDIVDLARRHPDLLKRYVNRIESEDPSPYDFARDEEGAVTWYEPTKRYVESNPVSLDSKSESSLANFVEVLVQRFKHFIEQEDGWRLLWRGNRRKNEPAARNLLLGIVLHYCRACEVQISSLPAVGKDVFSVSVGDVISINVLLEMKLAINTRHWNALHKVVPVHEKAARARVSKIMAVTFTESDDDRFNDIQEIVKKLKPEYGSKLYRIDASSDDAHLENPPGYTIVAQDNAVIHVGDSSITVDGNVTGSAFGPGASIDARDIAADNTSKEGTD